MVDTPTTRNRFRKQETGTNNNTWGIKLNQVLDCVDQVTDGVEEIALTSSADYTLTTTNYTVDDEAKNRVLWFTGTLSSAVNVILPSVQHNYAVINECGAALTAKTALGTGVTIPNNRKTLLYSDGVNYYSAAPTWIGDTTTLTNANDLPTYSQVQTLIANATLPATAGTVRNSANDTTAGYLSPKITVQIGTLTTTQVGGLTTFSLATVHAGGDEQALLTVGGGFAGGYLDGGEKSAAFTPVVGTQYTVGANITIQIGSMVSPQLGQSFVINQYNNCVVYYSGTINGLTGMFVQTNSCDIRKYSGPTWGWN